jgi:hypothetical protein
MVLEEGTDGRPYGDFIFDDEDAFGHRPKVKHTMALREEK